MPDEILDLMKTELQFNCEPRDLAVNYVDR